MLLQHRSFLFIILITQIGTIVKKHIVILSALICASLVWAMDKQAAPCYEEATKKVTACVDQCQLEPQATPRVINIPSSVKVSKHFTSSLVYFNTHTAQSFALLPIYVDPTLIEFLQS